MFLAHNDSVFELCILVSYCVVVGLKYFCNLLAILCAIGGSSLLRAPRFFQAFNLTCKIKITGMHKRMVAVDLDF